MKNNYRKLGDYIQPVDIRNSDLKVSHLLGLSIEKCFIESIANTIGTDFRPYKIVKRGQFAYGPVTSRNGDKITIALLKEADVCIISSSYSVFEITDTTKLLPEYLMLWFSRPEFDRYARYKSHGSVREIFDWDEMCRVELPVPDLKEQEKIVNTYNAITKRIQLKQKINENLEKTAQLIYKEMFEKNTSNWQDGCIGDILQLQRGHDLPRSEMKSGCIPVTGSTEIIGYHNEITTQSPVIVMGRSGNIGNPRIYFCDCWVHNTALYVKQFFDSDPIWVFYLLKNLNYSNFSGGSAVPTLDRKVIHSHSMKIPPNELQKSFSNKVRILLLQIDENKKEISKLQELKQLVISRISGM